MHSKFIVRDNFRIVFVKTVWFLQKQSYYLAVFAVAPREGGVD